MSKLNWTMQEKNAFVADNMNLIHKVTQEFDSAPYPYDDLFQTACVGLTKAFHAFDDENGAKFTTYAVKCMRNEILCMLRRDNAKRRSGKTLVSFESEVIDEDGKEKAGYQNALSSGVSVEDRVASIILYEKTCEVMNEILSADQRDALYMVACGYTYEDIAKHLVSKMIRNVRYHLRHDPRLRP